MKKGLEFNFSWMFAIIVGAIILFIAIYAANKYIGVEKIKLNAVTAKQFSIIFEPLETGIASGIKPEIIKLKEESEISFSCYDAGTFGKQKISFSGTYLGKTADSITQIDVTNKYIFSDDKEKGKNFYFFSKSFNYPYKVSEIIIFSSKSFCFVNAPDEIKEEAAFYMPNVHFNCSESDIKVCFGNGNCPIKVFPICSDCGYEKGYVTKNTGTVFYNSDLLFAAIISNTRIYECNLKRLMKRAGEQAILFKEEGDFIYDKCGNSASSELISFSENVKNFKSSQEVILYDTENLDRLNDISECRLW